MLSGLAPWKRFTVTILDPQSAAVEWTSEDEAFVTGSDGQRTKTNTLYADQNGRASWTRLNALDPEGQWSVQIAVDGQQLTARYTLQPLQLSTTSFSDIGVSMRRYAGSSSDVFASSGVPLSVALDLSGFLTPLADKLRPWVGVTSTQIPSVFLFSNTDLLRTAARTAGAITNGLEIGLEVPFGRFRGTYVTLDAFNSRTTKVLIHEFTHLLVDEKAPGVAVPVWLNEGLATYLENQLGPDFGALLPSRREIFLRADTVTTRLASNSLIPLSQLVSQLDWNAQSDLTLATLQYSEAYMAVRYITERFGSQAVGLILGQLGATRSFDLAFSAVTGITLATFEQDWRAWLRTWQDPAREQLRQHASQVSGILGGADAIQADRSSFLASAAGSGPFSGRLQTQTQLVSRATALLDQASSLKVPGADQGLQADLVAFLTAFKKWLQTELNAFTTGDNSLVDQANAMIPEVNGRSALVKNQLGSVQFNFRLTA